MVIGELRKMNAVHQEDDSVEYTLKLNDTSTQTEFSFGINSQIGKSIKITFTGNIHCTSCGVKVKKTFQSGLCYKCFTSSPSASPCILRPELCEAHVGKGRDVEWEEKNHNQPHIVYLTAGDVIKVGVTRKTQVPTRWIDQGAVKAIKLAETPYRQLAGEIEVALKNVFVDKTNWRRMLTNQIDESLDLEEEKWHCEELLPADLAEYMVEDDDISYFNYPVLSYPKSVKSVSLDKHPEIQGELIGVKGQYLIFSDNTVFNVRKHEGYQVTIETF